MDIHFFLHTNSFLLNKNIRKTLKKKTIIIEKSK